MSHRWMKKREVAAEYDVTERTVDRWTEAGRLRAYRVGGQVRFKVADVQALARPIASAGVR